MMKFNYHNILSIIIISLLSVTTCFGQVKYSGTWKGFQISDKDTNVYNEVYYLDFIVLNGLLDGKMKIEKSEDRDEVELIQIKGQKKYIDVKIKEIKLIQSSSKIKSTELNNLSFTYNLERGYLEGYSDDSSSKGKIVLFKSDYNFNSKVKKSKNRNWIKSILQDYNNGLSSPEKRLEELRNFIFEPIYFDYDKDIIKEEFHDELYKIKKMVLSHSDLRILVIGHTDSDGSDYYNKSLSKRRAESIIRFFTKNGLRRDRIVIDFKGESSPVDSNKTTEGRSRNRRVDFRFI